MGQTHQAGVRPGPSSRQPRLEDREAIPPTERLEWTVTMKMLDGMGMKRMPKCSGECLFEIIMRREELRSTMMISSHPFEAGSSLRE